MFYEIIPHHGLVQVQIAANRWDLLGGHFLKHENEQEYYPPPYMREFRNFLEAVEKEVREYKLWPVRAQSGSSGQCTEFLIIPSPHRRIVGCL